MIERLCVFCGSNRGNGTGYAQAVRDLGTLLASREIGTVFGGGGGGLMGELADAVIDAGGDVIGVLPRATGLDEIAHPRVGDIRVVGSMHERKAMMVELSDAFIAAPGGFGTLDEFFEVLTWGQLGLHAKPCGLLNADGYFDLLLDFIGSNVEQGFIRQKHREQLVVSDTAADLVDRLEAASRGH